MKSDRAESFALPPSPLTRSEQTGLPCKVLQTHSRPAEPARASPAVAGSDFVLLSDPLLPRPSPLFFVRYSALVGADDEMAATDFAAGVLVFPACADSPSPLLESR